MVMIDASLRRSHRSEEVESAWRLLEESGEVFASEYWFDNLCLCAWDLLENLHRLLCYLRVVDGYRVGVFFEFDDSLGAECAGDALRDLYDFGLGSLPCRLVQSPYGPFEMCLVRNDVFFCSAMNCSNSYYEGLDGIDHSSGYSLECDYELSGNVDRVYGLVGCGAVSSFAYYPNLECVRCSCNRASTEAEFSLLVVAVYME